MAATVVAILVTLAMLGIAVFYVGASYGMRRSREIRKYKEDTIRIQADTIASQRETIRIKDETIKLQDTTIETMRSALSRASRNIEIYQGKGGGRRVS